MPYTITAYNPQRAEVANFRKEKLFAEEYTLFDTTPAGGIREVAQLRVYRTRATHYVCFWVNNSPDKTILTSCAGAKSYCTEEASRKAMEAAGCTIDNPRARNTEPAYLLQKFAEFLGIKSFYIHHAHA